MPKNTPGCNTYMYNLHTVCESAHVNGALVSETYGMETMLKGMFETQRAETRHARERLFST